MLHLAKKIRLPPQMQVRNKQSLECSSRRLLSSGHEIVDDGVNAYFVCIILGHKSINLSSKTISILLGKFKRIMSIHPVKRRFIQSEMNF